MKKVQWLTEPEARAWRGLLRMVMCLEGALAHELAVDSDITYTDYAVLVALTDHPEGRLRLFELARLLGWEQSRLSHHVSRMAERGLVEKQVCSSDRRGAFVVVTRYGRAEIEAAAPGHVQAVRTLFVDLLTPQQLEAVAEISETVLARIDEIEREAE